MADTPQTKILIGTTCKPACTYYLNTTGSEPVVAHAFDCPHNTPQLSRSPQGRFGMKERYVTVRRVVWAEQALTRGIVQTLHGSVPYEPGDWLLLDPVTKDEWPIKDHEFNRRYVREDEEFMKGFA